MKSFGSRELISCLQCLGFKVKRSTGSSHLKFTSPKNVNKGNWPFVTVLLNKKVYDPHTQSSLIRNIKNLGFSEKEIESCLP